MYNGKNLKEKQELTNLLEYLTAVKENDCATDRTIEALESLKLEEPLAEQLNEVIEYVNIISFYEGVLIGARLNRLLNDEQLLWFQQNMTC